jgi:DNA-directed RNA polymerase specialized sigma24 family protein
MREQRPVRQSPPPQSPREEATLVAGLQIGDPAAISTFVNRSHFTVFALACRLNRDPDLRQDWTHSVLLRIIEELRKGVFVYRRPGSFWTWFRKRAYFLMLNQLNEHRTRGRREVAEGDLTWPLNSLSVKPGSSPADELERAEIRQFLEEGLSLIENRDQQRALWLLLDQDQIAEVMRAELNTVRSWIRRGRLTVRLHLTSRLDISDLNKKAV